MCCSAASSADAGGRTSGCFAAAHSSAFQSVFAVARLLGASRIEPPVLVRRHKNKQTPHRGVCLFGAGGRTRTGTLSLAVDFESTTSTNSITPAGCCMIIEHLPQNCKSLSDLFTPVPWISPSARTGAWTKQPEMLPYSQTVPEYRRAHPDAWVRNSRWP